MAIHQVEGHGGHFGIWDRNGAFAPIRMGRVPSNHEILGAPREIAYPPL